MYSLPLVFSIRKKRLCYPITNQSYHDSCPVSVPDIDRLESSLIIIIEGNMCISIYTCNINFNLIHSLHAMALKCIIQMSQRPSVYSDIARCLQAPNSQITDSEENSTRTLFRCRACSQQYLVQHPVHARCRVCSSILLILNMHGIHSEPCYMHVCIEVRVLHSCVFIIVEK